MDAAFSEPQNDDERQIKALIDEFNAQQASEFERELFKQRKRLDDAERTLPAGCERHVASGRVLVEGVHRYPADRFEHRDPPPPLTRRR